MRIAALYDVHGNLPALEGVLADLDRDPPDAIVCGGDVLWGPLQSECLELLRGRGARFVRGNCERMVASPGDERDEWCAAQLDDEQLAFAAGLPLTLVLDDVLFCHASPRSDEEILTSATPDSAVSESLAGVAQRLVVVGHTHSQLDRRLGAVRLVNGGSVGLPYEGRPGAFWALVEDGAVEHRRTEYEVDEALRRLSPAGFPGFDRTFPPALAGMVTAAEAAADFERQAGRGA